MARKGKDLFVLLGERLNPASQGSNQGGGQGNSQGRSRRQEGGVGGWLRSLFRAVSGPAPTGVRTGARPAKSRPGTGRKNTPRVPRSLLVPGWFVILLLLLGVTAGFVAGRWSADRHGDALSARLPKKQGVLPGGFPDGGSRDEVEPRLQAGYLPPEKQEEQVATHFFVTLDYPPSQRERAEALARYLRGQGLESTRIRKLQYADGSFRWFTLCYVRDAAEGKWSVAHAKECYAQLKRLPPPKFEPRLAAAVQRIESAHHLYSCKPER